MMKGMLETLSVILMAMLGVFLALVLYSTISAFLLYLFDFFLGTAFATPVNIGFLALFIWTIISISKRNG